MEKLMNTKKAVSHVSAILALLGVLCPEALAGDWPQFLGPTRNSVSAEKGLIKTWSKKGPPVVWMKDIGTGFSGPVVAGKRLILFHRLDNKEVVECFHAIDGKRQWKFAYPTSYQDDFDKGDGPRSTPVIAGKYLYTLGAEGLLHCLELKSGEKVWGKSITAAYKVPKNFFGVGTTPLVEGKLLLVNVGGKGAGIVAFAMDTGKEVWKATDDGASYSSPVAATIGGVRHVIFLTRQGIVSLDPLNGEVRFKMRWRARSNTSVNAATPVVVNDLVFISASYGTGAILLRVKKKGMDEVWKSDEVLSNHYDTSVQHSGFLYGCDGRQEEGARLRCVELKTGKVRWTKKGFGCGSMILADGHLRDDRKLLCLNLKAK
jgi:outer membrane protein assembly factor BamB